MVSKDPLVLRAEARLLATAGLILLALAFPLTLALVAYALSSRAISPVLPLAVGLPPIMLGYLACHFATQRMMKAKELDRQRQSSQQSRKPSASRKRRLTA